MTEGRKIRVSGWRTAAVRCSKQQHAQSWAYADQVKIVQSEATCMYTWNKQYIDRTTSQAGGFAARESRPFLRCLCRWRSYTTKLTVRNLHAPLANFTCFLSRQRGHDRAFVCSLEKVMSPANSICLICHLLSTLELMGGGLTRGCGIESAANLVMN